jgi:EPS-associated MarR family transcriptional regulator
MCVHAVNRPLPESPRPVPSSPDTDVKGPQLALLRVLAENSDLSQRELSRSLGLSLGKTHYVLHALLDKGLVKARNFTRSDNKLGYSYFLTPAGFNEKLRMTREFLARKEQEFEQLKTMIATLREEVTNEVTASAGAGPADAPAAPSPRPLELRQPLK